MYVVVVGLLGRRNRALTVDLDHPRQSYRRLPARVQALLGEVTAGLGLRRAVFVFSVRSTTKLRCGVTRPTGWLVEQLRRGGASERAVSLLTFRYLRAYKTPGLVVPPPATPAALALLERYARHHRLGEPLAAMATQHLFRRTACPAVEYGCWVANEALAVVQRLVHDRIITEFDLEGLALILRIK